MQAHSARPISTTSNSKKTLEQCPADGDCVCGGACTHCIGFRYCLDEKSVVDEKTHSLLFTLEVMPNLEWFDDASCLGKDLNCLDILKTDYEGDARGNDSEIDKAIRANLLALTCHVEKRGLVDSTISIKGLAQESMAAFKNGDLLFQVIPNEKWFEVDPESNELTYTIFIDGAQT
jgi:hypothetical protein